jgi:5-methylcytosine-specific restriction endonuclease McrA
MRQKVTSSEPLSQTVVTGEDVSVLTFPQASSTRRTKQGGWVDRRRLAKGPHGRSLCRWCGQETPKGRFTFCSEQCVHEWKLRTDPGYLREQVFQRDHGVCAVCGADTEMLRRDKRKLDYAARRRFEREWGVAGQSRRSLWDADHILPVCEGGGECDLSNLRTLCLKCHRQATTDLRRRRGRTAPP